MRSAHSNSTDKNEKKKDSMASTGQPAPLSASARISAKAWKTTAILSCVATMVMYAETMLIPALPDLLKDFGVSYSMSSWILSAYLLTGAVMTPIVGKLSDTYGRKKVLLIVMAIYLVGVSMAGLATNIVFMLVARAIQGIGLSMFPIAFGIIREQFPREKIAIGQGIITSMFASGAVIGLLVGGIIIENYGWQTTFFTIIPITVALILLIRRFIIVDDEQRGHGYHEKVPSVEGKISFEERDEGKYSIISRIDITGVITLATAVTSFLLILTFMETGTGYGGGFSIFGLAILGIISFLFFIMAERRVAHPLIDFKLILHKAILPANLIIMIVGLLMFMVFQTIPILVRNPQPLGFGQDAIATGTVQLPFALVLLVFGASSGFIIAKLGSVKPIIGGCVITAISFSCLSLFHSSELAISASLALLSVGLSLTSVGAMNVIILSTPKQVTGVTLGTTLLMRVIGSSIGPAVAGMLMQGHQSVLNISGILQSFPSSVSFNLIFLTAAVLSMACIGLAIILRNRVMKMSIPNLA